MQFPRIRSLPDKFGGLIFFTFPFPKFLLNYFQIQPSTKTNISFSGGNITAGGVGGGGLSYWNTRKRSFGGVFCGELPSGGVLYTDAFSGDVL